MSRIGSKPITIPEGVNILVQDQEVVVKGPKGELQQAIPGKEITVTVKDKDITVTRKNDNRQTKAFHGLVRSLIANMVTGVTDGYEKRLEMVGTGYRVKKEGEKLVVSVGYSHPVDIACPPGITLDVEGNNIIIVKGIDKQLVGETAANIRAIKKPEPYKGKGIRYQGEVVRRKAGKAAKAAE